MAAPFDLAERTRALVATFTWPERLLYACSKNPEDVFQGSGYPEPTRQWNRENALSEVLREFPNLPQIVRGKRVLDYGCGDGFQSVALADMGAREVLGVDIALPRLEHGRKLANGVANVSFAAKAVGTFDVAISLNSFEHFPHPEMNLAELAGATRNGGKILITFGSPWLSPWGSHMDFFTHVPWVNILFSERTVFHVRRLYRDDDGGSYFPDMNKMTIRRFEKIVRESGLTVERLTYRAVRGLPLLTHLPALRELFINQVTCVLAKQLNGTGAEAPTPA